MKRFLKWCLVGPLPRVLLPIILLVGLLLNMPVLHSFDRFIFRQMVKLRPVSSVENVVVVAIDDTSISRVGSWPWPRLYLAEAVARISEQEPEAIGFHILLPDLEWNPGLAGLRSLTRKLKLDTEKSLIGRSFAEMQPAIDGDAGLAGAVENAGRVVVPYRFTKSAPGEEVSLPPHLSWENPETDWQRSLALLHNPLRRKCFFELRKGILASFDKLAEKTPLQGHITFRRSRNDRSLSISLLESYENKLFPAMSLQLAGIAAGKKNPYLKVEGQTLLVNGREIPTGDDFDVLVNPETEQAISRVPFFDVINNQVPEELFKGKLVLLGLTTSTFAPGGMLVLPEPPPVVSSAAVAADLVAGRQIIRPYWAFLLESAVLAYLGIFLALVLPRLKLVLGSLLQCLFFLSWVAVVLALLLLQGMWFQVAPHTILLVAGLFLILLQRFMAQQGQNYDDLKMLGLSFQSQGMLDMAFDKFRQCPVSDKSIREILYNLALDFERKRMFNKAIAVYSHLLKGGRFKDARKKISELKKMEQSVVLGNGAADGTLIIGKGATAPTLGRYEVIRELGQGAMGTVYLGRDPKINREVAIKTLNLQDIEPDQIAEVKERFFREAEAAGRLNHPHIVTIYDAGEEHDLAYMAMEYLAGKDLAVHCSKESLLPTQEVLRIAADVAEALAYAHRNDVVHRDIKPSNLMLLDNGQIKVTDFGIARVVNSSQTQTGTILGTPSYMSPEQVSGDKVKGASDLFSLGVVCYEMFSGQKPFVGDSLGALMHNIANVKYTPLKRIKPGLPDCCYTIVRKLLKKESKDRYSSAEGAAEAIRKCIGKAG